MSDEIQNEKLPDVPGDDDDSDEIEVRPTKSLFVDMLTRDIALGRAILDLVDNSIDGARRLRPGVTSDLTGLEIIVDFNKDSFSISDNCGGISIDLARRYAFRIGRPAGMESTPNSVGQFGVGMKRALFKFGRYFEVDSKTQSEAFKLKVDVDTWVKDDTNWKFKFDHTEKELDVPIENTKTAILVKNLRADVASSFSLDYFKISTAREIQAAEQEYIDRGLRIVVNGQTLIATPWKLSSGSGMVPARQIYEINSPDEETIFVRIFTGISDSSPKKAGWYIFCNGRMVLEADQTSATGWDVLGETDVPKFHNQFARFRGYVFFDCKDARRLPWNTTKTGVDADSAIYNSIKLRMIECMRPVIDFLNDLDAERDNSPDDQPLTKIVTQAISIPLKSITITSIFKRPEKIAPSGPPQISISFKRPADKIDELKDALDASSRKRTGELAFDLAYSRYVAGKP